MLLPAVVPDVSDFVTPQSPLQSFYKDYAYLRHALNQSTIVAVMDEDGVLIDVNEAFCRISRYRRAELLGNTHQLLNSGHHSDTFFWNMWKTIRAGSIWRGEIKNRDKQGGYFWVYTTIVPILNDAGRPDHFMVIQHDITRQKDAEADLKKLNEELEQRIKERTAEVEEANRLKSRILSFVAHDFKTPLVGIQRVAELLLEDMEGTLNEAQRHMLSSIAQEADQLRAMASGILDKASAQEGRITPTPKMVCIKAFLDELQPLFGMLADDHGVTFSVEIPTVLMVVKADPMHLRQIVLNLFSNAVKYNKPNGHVTVRFQMEGTRHMMLEISDTGIGIPADKISRLFTEFYRTDISQKTGVEGTGLGLAFVKKLVELHHGHVEVVSQVGVGSTFRVILPTD